MLGWLYLASLVAAAVFGFLVARNFVSRRLRFVDAVRSPFAPWIAGIVVALVTWPVAALPFITIATTNLLGLGAGLGTASGVKALKRGDH